MSQCGSVGMDRYWNYVATPLFFVVISFGVFSLFSVNKIQLASSSEIQNAIYDDDGVAAPVAAGRPL